MNQLEVAIEVMKSSLQIDAVVDYETFAKYCFDIAEAMLAEEVKRKEDPEGWIEWNGGECPTDPCTIVGVQFRNGESCKDARTGLRWCFANYKNRCDPDYDIVAYRVVK